VKEALSNILRHASASEVGLKIAQPDGRLEIVITDDGQGFDRQRIRAGDGLKNLHERMRALSGTCCIESVPGQGTTVTLNVPLPEEPAPLKTP